MTDLHVLRVFIGPDGRGGNPLGVFLDGAAIAPDRRQAVAAELGFSETVFVDGIETTAQAATVRIFTPAGGHNTLEVTAMSGCTSFAVGSIDFGRTNMTSTSGTASIATMRAIGAANAATSASIRATPT